jgi:hypothetical protein
MIPVPEYWQAVALGIEAEDRKATLFIRQNDSLGAAREAILRDLIRRQTPEPFRVRTGFVFQVNPEPWSSRQCDILVYDPTVAQPYYEIGELVVVPRPAARAVVEVKTGLEERTFNELLGVWETTFWLPVPTIGFAYGGVSCRRPEEPQQADRDEPAAEDSPGAEAVRGPEGHHQLDRPGVERRGQGRP